MNPKKKTLVLGASENPDRYSNLAIRNLRLHNHEVIAIGKREGEVQDVKIIKDLPDIKDLDTVTLYLNPRNQVPYYDYILSLHPKRIIFNPGAENPELHNLANKKGIQTDNACTLVLLSTGQY